MKWLKLCSKKDVKKTECTELGKITDTSNLVKETDYDRKIGEIEKKILDHNHDKYITTRTSSKLTPENFGARLKQTSFQAKMILLISQKRQFINYKN